MRVTGDWCRVGDILESVNGQSMANTDHRAAVRAVKESKGTLIVVGVITGIYLSTNTWMSSCCAL